MSRYLNLIRSYLHCRRERNDRKEKHNRKRDGKELKFVILWKKDGIFPFFIDLQGLKGKDFFRDKKKMKIVYPCFLWPRHQGEF